MKDRVFEMDIAPLGHRSKVLLDGDDISSLLRGVTISTNVGEITTVQLRAAALGGAKVKAIVPEAMIRVATWDLNDAQPMAKRIVDFVRSAEAYEPHDGFNLGPEEMRARIAQILMERQ